MEPKATWGEVWEEVIWPFILTAWICYIVMWVAFEAASSLM